jgi:hypothetical protein
MPVSTIGTNALTSGLDITSTTGSFSGNLSFNSGYGSAAVAYGCRAWVNFNGTSTVAIRASGNVSSITDNGTGDYTVNFTTSMPDANYSVGSACGDGASGSMRITGVSDANPTASAYRMATFNLSSTRADPVFVLASFFR